MSLSLSKTQSYWNRLANRMILLGMVSLMHLIWSTVTGFFRPRASLEAENLALRQQLNVQHRKVPKRRVFGRLDRLIVVFLCRLFPGILNHLTIVQPETVLRWHRTGFRQFWRWKSRNRGGCPKVPAEIRKLIRDMIRANRFWGAPRIRGELLKLGIDVGQTSVAKYMVWHRKPPSQGWKTFLRNHAHGIASIDLFVVPTATFRILYGLLILCHYRRRIIGLDVTAHPTVEWVVRRVTEACGWGKPPEYLIRDNDGIFGTIFKWRVRSIGIRDRPTAPRSPWQNGYAERLIGSIRRECIDHVVVFGERHLRHLLQIYAEYYNQTRTHLSLGKDLPLSRAIEAVGRIIASPVLGGLHHRYARI